MVEAYASSAGVVPPEKLKLEQKNHSLEITESEDLPKPSKQAKLEESDGCDRECETPPLQPKMKPNEFTSEAFKIELLNLSQHCGYVVSDMSF